MDEQSTFIPLTSSRGECNIPSYFVKDQQTVEKCTNEEKKENDKHDAKVIEENERHSEALKKINIQKSIAWCEKYKIPCNKFIDKFNIFLNV